MLLFVLSGELLSGRVCACKSSPPYGGSGLSGYAPYADPFVIEIITVHWNVFPAMTSVENTQSI
jgi:hypothetical protein